MSLKKIFNEAFSLVQIFRNLETLKNTENIASKKEDSRKD
jgi:hypothetical protein